MKFIIKHEIKGRLRIHVVQERMTCAQALLVSRETGICDRCKGI